VASRSAMDYGGFTDIWYFITCPGCGTEISVPSPR